MSEQLNPTTRMRRADERGRANHGWLQARFTFSFADYHDPEHMGFRSLRVMNNDTIAPGGGFPVHPHRDMEIFTYAIDGELEHRDSMGNGSVIKAGDLQYMSAGSGIQHSEFNPSEENPTTLYQVWLQPNQLGGAPRYSEKPLGEEAGDNALTLLFSADGRDGSTAIRQNAEIYFGKIGAGKAVEIPASESTPHVWVQVIQGEVTVSGEILKKGDGVCIENFPAAQPVEGQTDSKILLFRLS